jgi:hypothetical protein
VSACIALVVCITASAAGASLVRSLKQHPKPQASSVSAQPVAAVSTAASRVTQSPAPTASSAPLVVNLESLSVEHKPTLPRAVRVAPRPAPTESNTSSDETSTANDGASESSTPEPAKSSDLPAAARTNPYGNGSLIDQIKRATADEEAGQ